MIQEGAESELRDRIDAPSMEGALATLGCVCR